MSLAHFDFMFRATCVIISMVLLWLIIYYYTYINIFQNKRKKQFHFLPPLLWIITQFIVSGHWTDMSSWYFMAVLRSCWWCCRQQGGPCLLQLNHISRLRPFVSDPLQVMKILSLAAWPLVILFHRPAPCWSQHNGRRLASSQSIPWQTWLSKLVSFGKGMTKDLFNIVARSIKASEQHVSIFSLLLPTLASVWLKV